MVQIFIYYFVCVLCIQKLEHSKNKILVNFDLLCECNQSDRSEVLTMSLYRYFAKASKQSELPNPNGALSASLPQSRRQFDRTLALP